MPKYKVLRAIEHNLKLYLPELADAVATTKSAGNGSDIPVDASGSIELSEPEAAALIEGQIPVGDDGKAIPLESGAPESGPLEAGALAAGGRREAKSKKK